MSNKPLGKYPTCLSQNILMGAQKRYCFTNYLAYIASINMYQMPCLPTLIKIVSFSGQNIGKFLEKVRIVNVSLVIWMSREQKLIERNQLCLLLHKYIHMLFTRVGLQFLRRCTYIMQTTVWPGLFMIYQPAHILFEDAL